MEAERQQMIEKMTAVRSDLVALVEGLDEPTRTFRPNDGRWTIWEIVAHLVDAEKAHRRFIKAVLAGKEITPRPDFDLDRWNNSHVGQRAGQSTTDLLAELAAQRVKTLAVIRNIPAEAWLKEARHPALGQITLRQVTKVIGIHEKMHLRDIQAVLAEM